MMNLISCRYVDQKKPFLSGSSEWRNFHIRNPRDPHRSRNPTFSMMTFPIRKFSKFHIDLPHQQRLDSLINNQPLRRHTICHQMAFVDFQNNECQRSDAKALTV